MLIANVIFPAYYAAYLSWLFFPLSIFALLSELAILRAANPGARWWKVVSCVLGMNLVSTACGALLAPYLFVGSGLIFEVVTRDGVPMVSIDGELVSVLTRGPEFGRLSKASFFQAGALSVVIELAAVLPFRRFLGLRRIVLPIVVGNIVSYVILFLAYHALFGVPPW